MGGWVRNFLSRALNFYTEWFSNLFRRQSIWKAWYFLKNTMKYWLIYLIPGYAIGTVLLPDNMTICAWCKNCHLEYTCPRKEQAVGLNMIGCFRVVLVIFVCCSFTYFSSASSLGSRCPTFQKNIYENKTWNWEKCDTFFPLMIGKKYHYLVSWQNTPINTSETWHSVYGLRQLLLLPVHNERPEGKGQRLIYFCLLKHI